MQILFCKELVLVLKLFAADQIYWILMPLLFLAYTKFYKNSIRQFHWHSYWNINIPRYLKKKNLATKITFLSNHTCPCCYSNLLFFQLNFMFFVLFSWVEWFYLSQQCVQNIKRIKIFYYEPNNGIFKLCWYWKTHTCCEYLCFFLKCKIKENHLNAFYLQSNH